MLNTPASFAYVGLTEFVSSSSVIKAGPHLRQFIIFPMIVFTSNLYQDMDKQNWHPPAFAHVF